MYEEFFELVVLKMSLLALDVCFALIEHLEVFSLEPCDYLNCLIDFLDYADTFEFVLNFNIFACSLFDIRKCCKFIQ